MKNKFIALLILVLSISSAYAQIDSLKVQNDIITLESKVKSLENNLTEIENARIDSGSRFENLNRSIDSLLINYKKLVQENNSLANAINSLKNKLNALTIELKKQKVETNNSIHENKVLIELNTSNIKTTTDELGVEIEDSKQSTDQSISNLNKTISQNTLYWIIAILLVALLVLVVFILLRKQLFKQRTDLDSNLKETRKVLEEEGVKLDNKLIEVLERQLKIINNNNLGTEKEADHTLALKVADEIIRIQKNLIRMDEKTKGLKQLIASIKRIQDNFASNGYEIVEMLGKPFNDGMKLSANFIPDEDLEEGEQKITRIIKPQVNYKDVMIQSAQIEVSQG